MIIDVRQTIFGARAALAFDKHLLRSLHIFFSKVFVV